MNHTQWWVAMNDLRSLSKTAWTVESDGGYADLVDGADEGKLPDYSEFACMIDSHVYESIKKALREDDVLLDKVIDFIDAYYRKENEEVNDERSAHS